MSVRVFGVVGMINQLPESRQIVNGTESIIFDAALPLRALALTTKTLGNCSNPKFSV